MNANADEHVARPTEFGELIPATVVLVGWLGIIAKEGWQVGLDTSWALLIVLPLVTWTLIMRLRYCPTRLELAMGPWRRRVDLTSLQSVRWKMTGGWRSQGTIFVRDSHGGLVPIYVGRFGKLEHWGPLLLDAAARCEADVDAHTRSILTPPPPGR